MDDKDRPRITSNGSIRSVQIPLWTIRTTAADVNAVAEARSDSSMDDKDGRCLYDNRRSPLFRFLYGR